MTLGYNSPQRIVEVDEGDSKKTIDVVVLDSLTQPSERNRDMTPQTGDMIQKSSDAAESTLNVTLG